MRLRYRILTGVAGVLAIGVITLAVLMSHNAACGTPAPLPNDGERMQAVRVRCYGPPSVLTVETVEKPTPAPNRLLVKVRAAAVNPLDWHMMRGSPYFMRLGGGFGVPKEVRIGADFAGVVEAVGSEVTNFKPGDEVYGNTRGTLGEYVTPTELSIAHKAPGVSFEQAAAVPVAAITALQGLRDHGHVQAGDKVLVNGASGGVGTFAVQIAKALGAEVTAVCSTRNLELVRSLGADHVIDYTKADFTDSNERYDVILDAVANHSLSDLRGILTGDGALVIVGAGDHGDWIAPMVLPLKAAIVAPFVDQDLGMFMAHVKRADLEYLNGLMEAGKMKSVIDRRYALADTAAAIEYLETGRARGKVIVNVSE
jgi:NADPH:quinone reductase-like Zn-dependent oxidoreductase